MSYTTTVGELQRRALQKSTVGGLNADSSPQSVEFELISMLRGIIEKIKELESSATAVHSRSVANLSAEGKAALAIQGRHIGHELNKALEVKLQIAKRLVVVQQQIAQAEARGGYSEAVDDLRKLRACADSVSSGTPLSQAHRRRLAVAIGVAEDRVRASA